VKISEVCIRRPIFTSMMILALVVFGAVSFWKIGVDLFPDVDFPVVTVTVPYPGADPETVETEVTDKIEEAVNTISGIKTLRSESLEGLSQVFIEFHLEEDVDVASQEVRDKVAAIRGELPKQIDPPIIEKLDLDAEPILSIVVAGDASIRTLSQYAEDVLKPQIESISGVGNVRLVGDRQREVRIWIRGDMLRAYNLAIGDVLDALARENLEPPSGRVETGPKEVIVKTKGKFQRVEDFRQLVVTTRGGVPIYLRDVAWVEDGQEDFRSLARLNGRRAVALLVRRQSGQNVVQVADAVKRRVAELKQAAAEKGYQLIVAQDTSTFIRRSISEAQWELVRGGALAVLVILLFLRSLRGSFVAAVTIPTTIIATYAFVLAMGFTVNIMTMLALTISVGMIIDDSIVVLENTYRHMEEGTPPTQAAYEAIAEIGFAVVATSLAIVAVFVPVAFMEGIVGRFFYQFGLTVTFAVAVSTFIALTLSPMLCSRVLKVSPSHGRMFNFLERCFQAVERGYRALLAAALRFRFAVVGIAVLVFAASVVVGALLGKEFIPEADESEFNVHVQTPIGSSIHATSAVLEEVESVLQQLPGVSDTFTTIGAGVEQRVNVATVLTKLVPRSRRQYGQNEIMSMARDALAPLVEKYQLDLSVERVGRVSGGGFRHQDVQYVLRGTDLGELERVSTAIIDRFSQLPGVVDVNSTYDPTKPELTIQIDRHKAADLGVTVADIGAALRALVGGQEVTVYEEAGEAYDVRVRLAADQRRRPEDVLSVPVRTASGTLVELRNLVEVQPGTGPVQIDRQDRLRQITIVANLEKSKPLGEALADLAQIEKEVGLPPGVTSKVTGFGQMMEESFANINFSLMLAVVLIYMVLAAQFESLVHPFTIMLSLPLSIVGALGLLVLTGRTLNIFSMIGMIMLMGLVTKNAILLVDYTNLLRRQGLAKHEALLRAGPVRLRPILMTAFSTIAGMIPVTLGLGEGAETRAPMGTAIVGGMLTSTLLTLVVVPVAYSLLDDLGAALLKVIRRGAATAGELQPEATPSAVQPGADAQMA